MGVGAVSSAGISVTVAFLSLTIRKATRVAAPTPTAT